MLAPVERRILILLACCALVLSAACLCAEETPAAGTPLDWARENMLAGKYTEAIDILKKELSATSSQPSVTPDSALSTQHSALLLIEALRVIGKLAEARAL